MGGHNLTLDIHGNIFEVLVKDKQYLSILKDSFLFFISDRPNGKPRGRFTQEYLLENQADTTPVTDPLKKIVASLTKNILKNLADDYLFLHSSCVVKDGNAVLFCGPRGSGKTTTALIAMSQGHKIMSDDITMISRSRLTVYAFPHKMLLRPNTYRYMVENAPQLRVPSSKLGQVRMNVTPREKSARLGKIYLLGDYEHPALYLLTNVAVTRPSNVNEDLKTIISLCNTFETEQLKLDLKTTQDFRNSCEKIHRLFTAARTPQPSSFPK